VVIHARRFSAHASLDICFSRPLRRGSIKPYSNTNTSLIFIRLFASSLECLASSLAAQVYYMPSLYSFYTVMIVSRNPALTLTSRRSVYNFKWQLRKTLTDFSISTAMMINMSGLSITLNVSTYTNARVRMRVSKYAVTSS
jgi:hypothetical protein